MLESQKADKWYKKVSNWIAKAGMGNLPPKLRKKATKRLDYDEEECLRNGYKLDLFASIATLSITFGFQMSDFGFGYDISGSLNKFLPISGVISGSGFYSLMIKHFDLIEERAQEVNPER